jgi:hypothetical protein
MGTPSPTWKRSVPPTARVNLHRIAAAAGRKSKSQRRQYTPTDVYENKRPNFAESRHIADYDSEAKPDFSVFSLRPCSP